MARTRKLTCDLEVKRYDAPSGGWGSLRSLARSLTHNLVPIRGNLNPIDDYLPARFKTQEESIH
jgi:hypothetical protein